VEGGRDYVVRVVVPRRDCGRVRWLLEEARPNFRMVASGVQVIFDERRDLDVVEAVYHARLGREERRDLERRLAQSLRGSIGFFVIYRRRGDEQDHRLRLP